MMMPCGDPPFTWGPYNAYDETVRMLTESNRVWVTRTDFIPTTLTVTVDVVDDKLMVSASHWGLFELPMGIR